MAEKRTFKLDIYVRNGVQGSEIAASLRRIAEVTSRIVAAEPFKLETLLELLCYLEHNIEGISMAELEIGAYLAGLGKLLDD